MHNSKRSWRVMSTVSISNSVIGRVRQPHRAPRQQFPSMERFVQSEYLCNRTLVFKTLVADITEVARRRNTSHI